MHIIKHILRPPHPPISSSDICFKEKKLEDTARYAGPLLAPADGFAQGQGFFCPKIEFIVLFWPILIQKIQKNQKNQENPKLLKLSEIIKKNPWKTQTIVKNG